MGMDDCFPIRLIFGISKHINHTMENNAAQAAINYVNSSLLTLVVGPYIIKGPCCVKNPFLKTNHYLSFVSAPDSKYRKKKLNSNEGDLIGFELFLSCFALLPSFFSRLQSWGWPHHIRGLDLEMNPFSHCKLF